MKPVPMGSVRSRVKEKQQRRRCQVHHANCSLRARARAAEHLCRLVLCISIRNHAYPPRIRALSGARKVRLPILTKSRRGHVLSCGDHTGARTRAGEEV